MARASLVWIAGRSLGRRAVVAACVAVAYLLAQMGSAAYGGGSGRGLHSHHLADLVLLGFILLLEHIVDGPGHVLWAAAGARSRGRVARCCSWSQPCSWPERSCCSRASGVRSSCSASAAISRLAVVPGEGSAIGGKRERSGRPSIGPRGVRVSIAARGASKWRTIRPTRSRRLMATRTVVVSNCLPRAEPAGRSNSSRLT